ncbi:MAG: CRISPR-associated endonuclease Cas1 [Calditrichaeota bacterium]|nr:CRISPR-associated endonuclease Cas1 [Calditrichota bacterium]
MKESKTRITHFDEGFHYLGYLFCRSVILETSKQDPDDPFRWELLDESRIPPNSWPARCRISGKPLSEFIQQTRFKRFKELFDRPATLPDIPGLKPVYLGNYQQKLRIKHQSLRIEDTQQRLAVARYPIHSVQSLVLLGSIPVSMPTLYRLLRRQIPVFLCNRLGEPLGFIQPQAFIQPELWVKQQQHFTQPEFALQFSQEIVKAKIHNYLQCIRFEESPEIQDICHQLLQLQHSCENKTTLNGLRGVEGRAAALFYQAFQMAIGDDWCFTGRYRRPPTDPVNALLSLGYTILYHHLTLIILQSGLNPWQGIYHQSRKNYCALSSDIQEEFRFLIDRLILTLIRRKQLKPSAFPAREKSGGYYVLPRNQKADFIQKVEAKFLERIRLRQPEGEFSYREVMVRQVHQLKQIVLGERLEYQAFRRR